MWGRNEQDIFPCFPSQYLLRSHSSLWYHSSTLHLDYLVLQSLCGRWCTPTLGICNSKQRHNKIKSLHSTHSNKAMSSTERKCCENNHPSSIYSNQNHIAILSCLVITWRDQSSRCIHFGVLIRNTVNFQK